jgi:hypothetical protein
LVKTVLLDMQESDVIYFKSLWFMLQRQHDAKHKLAKNRRGSATTAMIRHTYLELHYVWLKKLKWL